MDDWRKLDIEEIEREIKQQQLLNEAIPRSPNAARLTKENLGLF